jgi:hypothetical protein
MIIKPFDHLTSTWMDLGLCCQYNRVIEMVTIFLIFEDLGLCLCAGYTFSQSFLVYDEQIMCDALFK